MIDFKNKLVEVINTDAIFIKDHFFFASHAEFENLEYVPSGNMTIDSKSISEEELFNKHIITNLDKHNLIVVQGDNGTGKSHLIKWLNFKLKSYKDEYNDEIVFIERKDATLKSALRQLLNIEYFDNDEEMKRKLSTLVDSDCATDEETIIDNIIAQLGMAMLRDSETQNNEISRSEREGIRNFITDLYIQKHILKREDGFIQRLSRRLVESSEIRTDDTEPKATIEDFDFGDQFLLQYKEHSIDNKTFRIASKISTQDEYKRKIVNYINSLLDIAIQRAVRINTSDFVEVFNNIRIDLKKRNKNLILLIEDITTLTGLDKSLLEALRIDNTGNSSDYCRLFSVVGITTSYYVDLRSNFRDRITSRIIINNESILGTKEQRVKFISRYINALYTSETELINWYNDGANVINRPQAELSKFPSWSIHNNTDLLYPFNENAIEQLFASLEIERRTPRYFLKEIVEPILFYFSSDFNKYPLSIAELKDNGITIQEWERYSDRDNSKLILKNKDDFERFNSFLLIYSDRSLLNQNINETVCFSGISINAYTHFGFDCIFSTPTETIKVSENNIPNRQPNGTNNNTKRILIDDNSQNNLKMQGIRNEIDKWLYENDDSVILKSQRETLVKLVSELINTLQYDFSKNEIKPNINISTGKFNLSLGKIVLETKSSNYFEEKLVIKRNEKSKRLLEAIANYQLKGNNSWGYDGYLRDLSTIIDFIEENDSFFRKIESNIREHEEKAYLSIFRLILSNFYYSGQVNIESRFEDQFSILMDLINDETLTLSTLLKIDKIGSKIKLTDNIIQNGSLSIIAIKEALKYFVLTTGDTTLEKATDVLVDIYKIKPIYEKLTNELSNPNEINEYSDKLKTKVYFIDHAVNKAVKDLKNYIVDDDVFRVINEYSEFKKNAGYTINASLHEKLNAYARKDAINKILELFEAKVNENDEIRILQINIQLDENGIFEVIDLLREYCNELTIEIENKTSGIGTDKKIITDQDVNNFIGSIIALENEVVL